MNIIEALKVIKAAHAVYGYVKLTEQDGQYVKLVKKDALNMMSIYLDDMYGSGIKQDVPVTTKDNVAYIN